MRTHRFTLAEYDSLVDLGFFEGKTVELLEGEIVVMSPQNPPHSWSTRNIADVLGNAFGPEYLIFQHSQLSLPGNSEPEPDVAVVKGSKNDFWNAHPTTAEVVVEVSLSSNAKDRLQKAPIYARAGISEYWIVNLLKNQLEILRTPRKESARRYNYSSTSILFPGEIVSPLAKPKVKIAVSDLFPPIKK